MSTTRDRDACGGWPQASFGQQAILAAAAVLLTASGYKALRRNRPRWIPVWAAGLVGWAIIPKYFICTRCENYGKPCDFFYGGKYAALLFRGQPDRPFNAAGYLAEGITLGAFQLLPVAAARRDPRSLAIYVLSAGLFQSLLIAVCCLECVRNARDPWKRSYCPTFKLARFILKLKGA